LSVRGRWDYFVVKGHRPSDSSTPGEARPRRPPGFRGEDPNPAKNSEQWHHVTVSRTHEISRQYDRLFETGWGTIYLRRSYIRPRMYVSLDGDCACPGSVARLNNWIVTLPVAWRGVLHYLQATEGFSGAEIHVACKEASMECMRAVVAHLEKMQASAAPGQQQACRQRPSKVTCIFHGLLNCSRTSDSYILSFSIWSSNFMKIYLSDFDENCKL
jgi:hypothetical protein